MPLDHGTLMNGQNGTEAALRRGKSRAVGQSTRKRHSSPHFGQHSRSVNESAEISGTAEGQSANNQVARRSHIEPWHWSDTQTSDLLETPGTRSEPLWQRIFVIALAIALAVLLDQVNW